MTNYIKTGMLIAAMTALFMGIGLLIGGATGMMIALVVAIGMNIFSYWNSDKMVLKMHDAHEVGQENDFYRLVEGLAVQANLPMPRVYIMDNPQPNAFATGRNPEHAAVAATSGIIAMLSREELEGVMAHELAHIQNRDILIMTMTATLAGAISMIAQWGMFFRGGGNQRPNIIVTLAVMFLAPLAASLVQMAISRNREYKADKRGAEICGKPMALAHALNKISGAAHDIPNPTAEANPASAHMFIINPLSGRKMDALFSTHPDTQNRIDALVEMTETGFTPASQNAGGYGNSTTQEYSSPADRYSRPDDYYKKSDTQSDYQSHIAENSNARPQNSDPWQQDNATPSDTSQHSLHEEDYREASDNPWDNGNNHKKTSSKKVPKADPNNPWG